MNRLGLLLRVKCRDYFYARPCPVHLLNKPGEPARFNLNLPLPFHFHFKKNSVAKKFL